MMLTIPGTSVEAERAFSSCAYLCNKLRTRLKYYTLDTLCFIRNNLKKPKIMRKLHISILSSFLLFRAVINLDNKYLHNLICVTLILGILGFRITQSRNPGIGNPNYKTVVSSNSI